MFNDYNTNHSVNIKTPCVGTLQKSHPKSYFHRCHVKSDYFSKYVNDNMCVLQIMLFGDNEALIEFLPKDVYEEWIKEQENKE